jgi:hypothetical protein
VSVAIGPDLNVSKASRRDFRQKPPALVPIAKGFRRKRRIVASRHFLHTRGRKFPHEKLAACRVFHEASRELQIRPVPITIAPARAQRARPSPRASSEST